ncbi:MAG: two-component sensor histidine kinase [Alphaproteobacteria bacterium]|nr:MAG: two-component sensor histidine kinase [Alphaproteobacteria bacterium]
MGRSAPLLDALPVPVLVVAGDQRVQLANRAARELLARDPAGRPLVTVVRHPAVLDAVEAVLAGGASRHARQIPRFGPAEGAFDVHVAPAGAEADGRPGAIILTVEEVSAREVAARIRRDFVANVSHELRTPLTSLLGFIDTLRGPAQDDPAARARFLDTMRDEAERMRRLVEDLMSLSRVEENERRRPDARVSVAEVVTAAIAALDPLAAERNARLERPDVDGGLAVAGDHDQLVQVVINLLENAIKYGGRGAVVRIAVSALPHEPALRGPAVRIEVADDGPGIDPVHLPRLTERFYRVDTHRSRALGGTGLGLAIVKHIVGRHRGRFRIDSAPGQGTRAIVDLPAWEVGAQGHGKPPPRALS